MRDMQRLERASIRRDTNAFRAFIFIGIVGIALTSAQIWAQLKPQHVNVTVDYAPTPSIQSTEK